MSAINSEIEQRIREHVADAVACHVLGEGDGRIGCVIPLQYPHGDNVTVWVRPRVGGEFEITDYGEALAESRAGKTKERENLEAFAELAAAGQGARFVKGRLFAECGWDDLPEYVWRVGMAASQLAQAASSGRSRQQKEKATEDEFVSTVDYELGTRKVAVERERQLSGASGHRHRATFFLPQSETVIEPVGGHWNQVTAVFARLADLGNANGYRLVSLLDDRGGKPEEDVPGLLVQVSNVVQWTRRDEWMPSFAGGSTSDS